ncbi:sensor histidine kinase [Dinghuibacter silviterrae]|uniref:histidine kinase n=1 Tax=Dinghuibacter silviterrae TaxID=1539049 RepID=A0A4V3GLW1_9BACT|nr:HAMP domain-containing sensor histidine kinase [Dinghuibacter silviterrae]TDX01033.1 signal transduction histidine kinase [Dinghuibacter silviterrae]
MKLAATYQRFYFVLLAILLALGCLSYYVVIRYILIHQVDNDLKIEQQELLDFVHLHDSLPAPSHYRDQQLDWRQGTMDFGVAGGPGHRGRDHDRDRRRFCNVGDSREVQFPVRVKGTDYIVTITKSLEETEDLLWLILWVTAGSILVLVAGLFIGNRFLLRRIWHPFYETLDYLKSFRLSAPPKGGPGVSKIDEFNLLGRSVEEMTVKMQRDYLALQQFTDHAAHEMQTPLAVIKSKLDLMMQEPGLTAHQLERMQQLLLSVNRLSRLNQSLLLLTRIENRQYLEKEPVELKTLVEEKLDVWQEWIREHGLTVTLDLMPETVRMHPFLAESLVNNLLSNAVRHNVPGGEILVTLLPGLFSVKNTGAHKALDPDRLFQRFQKQHPSEGVGLGLAIVKEIVEMSGMGIRYEYGEGTHTFTVTF